MKNGHSTSFLVDKDSKFSTYKSVNPELTSYVKNNLIIEYECKLIIQMWSTQS